MLRSMYSGISGMRGFQTKLDVIGNNIANVNTAGFKASRVSFSSMLSQMMAGGTVPDEGTVGGVNPKQIGLGVTIAAIDTMHTPGSAMTTNVPTDLRIDGDGFFVVSRDGTTATAFLTRDGNFKVDAAGFLVNSAGYFVMNVGAGGPIQIDPETYVAFHIAEDGSIIGTNTDGETEVIDQLGIARVVNPGGLEHVGGNLYRLTPIADPGTIEDVTTFAGDGGRGAVIAGQLEMSNVDLTVEFTEMIVAQRGFQANSRIITTSDDILQEVVNLKR